jgi:VanZ family protein
MWFRRLWPAIIWALIVLVITGLPGSYIPRISGFWDWISTDKIVHVFIFATLGFLIFYGFREQYLRSNRRYLYVLIVLLVTFLYGVATEVLQRHVFIGRNGNVYDFLADATGGLIGFLAFYLYFIKKRKRFHL